MLKSWLTVKEASKESSISDMTVRRWIKKHKQDIDYVKYEKGIYFVNAEKFSIDYRFIHDFNNDYTDFNKSANQFKHAEYSDKDENGESNAEKLALITISKQANDISQALLGQNKQTIYKHSSFWILVTTIVLLIAGGLSGGYYYKKEIMENNNSKIKDLRQNYTKQIEFQEKKLVKQQERYKEQEKQYSIFLSEIKSSNLKLAAVQGQHISELSSKLKELDIELKEAETAHTMALKNTDVLHVKYNEKIEQLEEKIKGLGQGSETEKDSNN
jgi:hypothetical protein